jgi:LPS sulfotransferase NodH
VRLVALPPRKQEPEPLGFDYSRFIILSGPRTGSNLLSQALGSNPSILCFRELFNFTHDFVQFDVDGYDNFDKRDLQRRRADPIGFLNSRVFQAQPGEIRAVGFKFQYGQLWGFPGLIEHLVADEGLRVFHLRRRNDLRTLVSLKLAQRTGVFMVETATKPPLARVAFAGRHPLRAANRIRRALAPQSAKVSIKPDELATFIIKSAETAKHYDKLFAKHPILHVDYEDFAQNKRAAAEQAARFLGAPPTPPVITLRHQHPEPLRDLVENYEELRDAFRGSPHEAMFKS